MPVDWDWTRVVFDHVKITVARRGRERCVLQDDPLLDPGGNNVDAVVREF